MYVFKLRNSFWAFELFSLRIKILNRAYLDNYHRGYYFRAYLQTNTLNHGLW